MKFTLPFFKKKSDLAIKEALDYLAEQAVEVMSPPKVDWGSVGADSFAPPSSPTQSTDSEGMASFEAVDIPVPVASPQSTQTSVPIAALGSTSTPIASELDDEVIPTPVKVAPQASLFPPIAEAERAPQPAFETVTEPATQPLQMTKEDVIAAYKIFLNRLPESTAVIDRRIGSAAEANLIQFVLADEFLKRPEVSPMILGVAKQIIDRQKATTLQANKPEAGQ